MIIGITAIDIVKALNDSDFKDVAQAVLNLQKQRFAVTSCKHHPSSTKLEHHFNFIKTLHDYKGPGTGYRLQNDKDEWERIKDVPFAMDPGHMQF